MSEFHEINLLLMGSEYNRQRKLFLDRGISEAVVRISLDNSFYPTRLLLGWDKLTPKKQKQLDSVWCKMREFALEEGVVEDPSFIAVLEGLTEEVKNIGTVVSSTASQGQVDDLGTQVRHSALEGRRLWRYDFYITLLIAVMGWFLAGIQYWYPT